MAEDIFVDGLFIKEPHPNAPDFIKMKISIKRKDLGNWLRKRDEDWINLDVKKSKNGNLYAAVDEWKPDGKQDPDDLGEDVPF